MVSNPWSSREAITAAMDRLEAAAGQLAGLSFDILTPFKGLEVAPRLERLRCAQLVCGAPERRRGSVRLTV